MIGRPIPLSPARVFVCDLLHAARNVPTVPVQRTMRLGSLITARAAWADRPSWAAIFAKAYGAVAARTPVLRRAYVAFPTPRLYEVPWVTASIAVQRTVDGEPAVLVGQVRQPEVLSLQEASATIRRFQTC